MSTPLELILTRDTFTATSTTGLFLFNGLDGFFALEDVDRGLDQALPLADNQARKVKGRTAIPVGRYQVVWARSPSRSERAGHDVYTPRLVDVPAFAGILVHSGGDADDTDGCILVSTHRDTFGAHSRAACDWLYPRIEEACAGPGCWITIQHDPVAWAAFNARAA
jgi:hypothetical protein